MLPDCAKTALKTGKIAQNATYEHRLWLRSALFLRAKAYIVFAKEIKMKVNVANYIYQDLVKRFPSREEGFVDKELIDVLIKKWANKEYFHVDSNLKLHHKESIFPPHLM